MVSDDTSSKKENSMLALKETTLSLPAGNSALCESEHATLMPLPPPQRMWQPWCSALLHVFPIYVAMHLIFAALTYLAALFHLGEFSGTRLPTASLLHSWFRWDSGQFTAIATKGYDASWHTAFFPLYPLLERAGMVVTHDAFKAGLLISNMALLVAFVVLYRLVQEDFDADTAYRTVLYLAVFPTAFFLAAAYNESCFLVFTLLSFYAMRRGHWWLAGGFGFLAALTRSAGLLLLVPFCYEYLRQYQFHITKVRFSLLGGAIIPLAPAMFAAYCGFLFHNPLAFVRAQAVWHRQFQAPWQGISNAITAINAHGFLSFYSIHNVIDLSAVLLMHLLLVLCFLGPYKFPRQHLSYGLYALALLLFISTSAATDATPLVSDARFMLEMFPLFVTMAMIGKRCQLNSSIVLVSTSLMTFLLLLFLTGHWIV